MHVVMLVAATFFIRIDFPKGYPKTNIDYSKLESDIRPSVLRRMVVVLEVNVNRLLVTLVSVLILGTSVSFGQRDQSNTLQTAKTGSVEEAEFEKRVRPLLYKHCVPCHSEKTQLGGIRLDTAAGMSKIVRAGDPVASHLIEVVRYTGKHKMPPSGKLASSDIGVLTQWVGSGAQWPAALQRIPASSTHWSFIPPVRFTAPKVSGASTNIDAFIRQPVLMAGLKPGRPADRTTLIRRAYFDLIGLPPTPSEVQSFVNDTRPGAFALLIDALLAKPSFGERWGRHWLDVARYADSNGLDENLAHGSAYYYRDWVVKAINQDLPYDRFVQYQIAGDLLPYGTTEQRSDQITATAFLSLGPKVLAEQDKPKMVMDIIDEQIEVVSKSVMGVTIACARCHDHKFDPISTMDYYALAGIFKSTKTMENLSFVSAWNERAIERGDGKLTAGAYGAALAPLTERLNRVKKEISAVLAGAGGSLTAATDFVTGNVAKNGYGPGSINSVGSPAKIVYKIVVPVAGKYRMSAEYASEESRSVSVEVSGKAALTNVAKNVTGGYRDDKKAWELLGLVTLEAGENTVAIRRDGPIPHFFGFVFLPESGSNIAALQTDLTKVEAEIAALAATQPAQIMVMAVDEDKPTDVRVHIRGDTLSLGETSPRGFPAALCGGTFQPLSDVTKSGRFALAQWMTRPNHPLTSRVMVDRMWRHLFGQGLTTTPDNWGLRGEKPANPKLLDTLAVTFAVDDKWSVKKFIKRVMLTDTYAQSSVGYAPSKKVNQTAKQADPMIVDPANTLLWRANRRRLDAEPLRDAMLFVSGKLDTKFGGTLLTSKNRDYITNDQSGDTARYDAPRRTLYLPVIRNAVYDYLQAFDFGDPSMVISSRTPTTVAPQALYMMNSPMVMDFAQSFATKVLQVRDITDEARRGRALFDAFGRPASQTEAAIGRSFFIAYDLALEDSLPDPQKRRRKIWDTYCQALLASNNFAYVE